MLHSFVQADAVPIRGTGRVWQDWLASISKLQNQIDTTCFPGRQSIVLSRLFPPGIEWKKTKRIVEKDLSVPGNPECYVVGDAAHVVGPDGRPLPGLASIAQHQGRYVGKLIAARIAGNNRPTPPQQFVPSKLATITRRIGVAEWGKRSITGFPAWLAWGLLHLRNVSGWHSKLSILANWLRLLVTYRRSSRLIVELSAAKALPESALKDISSRGRGDTVRLDVVVPRLAPAMSEPKGGA